MADSNLNLLIQTCPIQSCGRTSDFVLGCLYMNWSKEFILAQRYLNLNPPDFHGGNPGSFAALGYRNGHYQVSLQQNLNLKLELSLSELVEIIRKALFSNGYIGIELSDHAFVLILDDNGSVDIIDSYVHTGKHLTNFNRSLSRRSFQLDKFFELLNSPEINLWNQLFDNRTPALDLMDGYFPDIHLSA